ncbi:MAG: hypothetical protein E3K37_04120 [Candidatus Kuenenia sp.]|nr:hypothetical protein [Candidatus Kuenenia hertensis]
MSKDITPLFFMHTINYYNCASTELILSGKEIFPCRSADRDSAQMTKPVMSEANGAKCRSGFLPDNTN